MPALNLLTTARIAAEKPGDRPRKLSDGGGLFLLVTPAGGRWWRFRYRAPTGERLLSLGTYPETSLSLARQKAEDARRLLAQGLDPSELRKARKADQRAAADAKAEADAREAMLAAGKPVPGTFRALAEDFVRVRGASWAPKYASKVEGVLRLWLLPELGALPVGEVTPPRVLAACRKAEAAGRIETAHRCRGLVGEVMRYGIATGQAEADPAAALRGALQSSPVRHMAFIRDPAELGELLRAMWGYRGTFPAYTALRMAPYVFVRPGELRTAEWSEFDLEAEAPVWTIPASRMKGRRVHHVPLAPQVVELLRELHPLTGGGRYLFPSVRTTAQPMSDNTLNAAMRRLGYTTEQVQLHGFRHTASTMLNELGFDAGLIELQLAHADRDKVRATYNKSLKLAERRAMLCVWADHLDELRRAGRVIPFRRGAA